MAMVYDIPRLVHQTAFKIMLHVDTYFVQATGASDTRIDEMIRDFRTRFFNTQLENFRIDSDIVAFDLMEMTLEASRLKAMEEDADDCETYQRYRLSETAKMYKRKSPDEAIMSVSNFGGGFLKLIDSLNSTRFTKDRKVYTDWDAASRLLNHFMDHNNNASLTPEQMNMLTSSYQVSRELTSLSLVCCKVGNVTARQFSDEYVSPPLRCKQWRHYKSIYKGLESIRMSSMTPTVRAGHDRMRQSIGIDSHEDLQMKNETTYTNLGIDQYADNCGVYRWLNCYIIVLSDGIYVLDIANLEQLQIVMKQWEGAYLYATHYRKFGDASPDNYLLALMQVEQWMFKNFKGSGFSDSFCRVMKMALAILQNSFHSSSEKFETGWEDKDRELRQLQKDTLDLPEQFQDFLAKLPIKDRTKLDLACAHYFNICPDGDPHALFKKVDEDMANPNPGNIVKFTEFMNYSKTFFLCKMAQKFGSRIEPHIVCEPGYNIKDKPWFKAVLGTKANWRMPPYSEWGKAEVRGFFPYNDTISGWYFDADDVSHVIADFNNYSTYERKAALTQEDTNELLYALKFAPMLSYSWHPAELISHLAKGEDNWDRLSDLSVKPEANKPSHKARDIHAADDITRVLTSCVDIHSVNIGKLLPGVVSRKDKRSSDAIFDSLCRRTRDDYKGVIWVVSSDVSSWSPKAPRELWAQFNDLIMDATKAPKELRISKIWNGIKNMLGKRGYLRASGRSRGMYQGWTGTGDSCMHNALLGFIVNDAKRAGILHPDTTAKTATLIDDAVQIIEFGEHEYAEMDTEERMRLMSAICSKYSVMIREGYNDAGGVIDLAKTIMSTIKAIFLNKFVCEGSLVLTPMKVFAKCDRELSRRSATIFDQTDTIFGSYRSAVEKGSEPIMAYACAIERNLELISMSTTRALVTVGPGPRQASMYSLVNAAFAPRNFGGWGFPHIIGWLTKESPDPLVAYVSIMATADMLVSATVKSLHEGPIKIIRNCFWQTVGQEQVTPDRTGFIKDASRVCIAGVIEPRSAVTSKVRAELTKRAESEIFKALLEKSNDGSIDAALDEFLLCGEFSRDALCMLAECLPEHCASGLTDRALMNEMVQVLFPFRVRSRIAKTVKTRNKRALTHLLEFADNNLFHKKAIARSDIYTISSNIREDWYRKLGYRITNHTKQDYATSLTHHRDGVTHSLSIEFVDLISPCKGEGVDYANLYDGYVQAPLMKEAKARTALKFTRDFERCTDPVKVCLEKAAVMSTYLQSQGKNGVQFWEFVRSAWGEAESKIFPVVAYKANEMASIKRISPASSSPTHPIACYTGTFGAIKVDTLRFGGYVSASHYQGDILSIITTCRTIGLLEYSSFLATGLNMEYKVNFGFVADSLWEYNSTIWDIDYEDSFGAAIDILNKTPKPELREQFHRVMSASASEEYVDYEDQIASVIYNPLTRPSLATAYENREILSFAASGFSLPSGTYKSRRSTIIAGDLSHEVRRDQASKRFTRYASEIGFPSATVAILIEQVCNYLPNEAPLALINQRWSDIIEYVAENHGEWTTKWKSIRQGTRNAISPKGSPVDKTTFTKLFPTLAGLIGNDELESLVNFGIVKEDTILNVMVTLYMANIGRYRDKEGYNYAAKNGILDMKKSWKTTVRRWSSEDRDVIRRSLAYGFVKLHENVETARSGLELFRVFTEGLAEGLSIVFDLDSENIPPHNVLFRLNEETTREEAEGLRKWFISATSRCPTQGNARLWSKLVHEVIHDIKILSTARATRGAIIMLHSADLPTASNWESLLELQFEEDIRVGEEFSAPTVRNYEDPDFRYAAQLYFSSGIDESIAFLALRERGEDIERNPAVLSVWLNNEGLEEFEIDLNRTLAVQSVGGAAQDIE